VFTFSNYNSIYTTFYRLDLLANLIQKQNHKIVCSKYKKMNWKNLPKSIRRLWSFLAVNQSYPLNSWKAEQIAQQ